MKKNGLDPLLCDDPEVLILGSLPGDRSLELQQYYGHPQNRFWKVIAAILGEAVPAGYDDRKRLLARGRIVLWDVYAAARREGSMDADIRQGEFNDIFGLLARYPSVRAIGLNGKTAEKAFGEYCRNCSKDSEAIAKALEGRRIEFVPLPSTSPANARWTLEKLIDEWKNIWKK